VNKFLLQLSAQAENRFYGHIDIFAQYCGIDKTPWLNGYLQHGWNGCDGFSHYSGYKRRAKKYIWSKRALADQQLLGGSHNFVIGSPWLYSLKMNQPLKNANRSNKIIAYPLHSQPWAPKNYLHSEYANYLDKEFGSVTVCLHWSEYKNTDIINTYEDMGHKVVTNGVGTPWLENFDKNFLTVQQNHLKNHETFTTNAMQTSVLYALSMGLNIHFGGPASWVKKIDESGTYGKYGQEFWRKKAISEPEELWKIELGFDEIKSAENLKDILGWNKNKIKISFLLNRSLDLLTDTKFSEKIDYFKTRKIR